ncbi:hypothetical protein [Nocardioides lijunqiniae]|uniref:hypothetical protein n=1 Tax=Nocardioides lijunqiniae TaxID=2760832 RepID=UPI001878A1B9|nr:hypothetical protein [Nocardioides lijunqiniae]
MSGEGAAGAGGPVGPAGQDEQAGPEGQAGRAGQAGPEGPEGQAGKAGPEGQAGPEGHEARPDVPDDDYDIQSSDQDPSGDLGVSSEREGHAGPGQHAATGVRDTSEGRTTSLDDAPPEQSTGGHEPSPDGLEPKAGYSSKDPRSD